MTGNQQSDLRDARTVFAGLGNETPWNAGINVIAIKLRNVGQDYEALDFSHTKTSAQMKSLLTMRENQSLRDYIQELKALSSPVANTRKAEPD